MNSPLRSNNVVAKYAFLLRAQPQDRLPRNLIERVGHKFHTNATPSFKRMFEHQKFGFSINCRSRTRSGNPSRDNLKGKMIWDNIKKAYTLYIFALRFY